MLHVYSLEQAAEAFPASTVQTVQNVREDCSPLAVSVHLLKRAKNQNFECIGFEWIFPLSNALY